MSDEETKPEAGAGCEASEYSALLTAMQQLADDFDETAKAHFWDAQELKMKADNCKDTARKIRRKITELKGS
jgi:hypothetical protein